MKGPHEAPSGSLPVPEYLPPAHIAEGSPEWERGQQELTCRRSYHFVCSAWEECHTDYWLEATDLRKAERRMRDMGWSRLVNLGWTCQSCSKVYAVGRQGSALGPHKRARVVRERVRTRKRAPWVQEVWQQREAQG